PHVGAAARPATAGIRRIRCEPYSPARTSALRYCRDAGRLRATAANPISTDPRDESIPAMPRTTHVAPGVGRARLGSGGKRARVRPQGPDDARGNGDTPFPAMETSALQLQDSR